MPWKLPVTVGDTTYPLEFDSEPSPADIDNAVNQLVAQHKAPKDLNDWASVPWSQEGPRSLNNSPSDPDNPPEERLEAQGAGPLPAAEGAIASGVRPLVRGIAPAAGTLGVGALGGYIGGTLGLLGGPAAEFTVPLGALLGDIVGGWLGAKYATKAQNAVLGEQTVQEMNAQEAANQQANPFMSGLGSAIPGLISASPVGLVRRGITNKAGEAATTVGARLLRSGFMQSAIPGARMQAAQAESMIQSGQAPDDTSIPEEALKGAITMGPLGFLPHADQLLARVLGRAPSRLETVGAAMLGRAPVDALTMTTAQALYDYGVHGKPIDLDAIAAHAGGDIPGFMILNGVTALFHGHAVASDPLVQKGQEIVSNPNSLIPPEDKKSVQATTDLYSQQLDLAKTRAEGRRPPGELQENPAPPMEGQPIEERETPQRFQTDVVHNLPPLEPRGEDEQAQPIVTTPPNEPAGTTGVGQPEPTGAGPIIRPEEPASGEPPPPRSVGTIQGILEDAAERAGGKVEYHDDPDRPVFNAYGNERGNLTVEARSDLAQRLSELPRDAQDKELNKILNMVASEGAIKGIKTGKIFDKLRTSDDKSALTAALELDRDAPFENGRQRTSALAGISKAINEKGHNAKARASQLTHGLISRLVRASAELATRGTTSEAEEGFFGHDAEWQKRTHDALQNFRDKATAGEYGPEARKLMESAERAVRIAPEESDVKPSWRAGQVVRGVSPTAEQAERARALAVRNLPIRPDQIVMLHTPEDVRALGEASGHRGIYNELADSIEYDGKRPEGWFYDGKVHIYVPGVQVMAHDASAADAVYHTIAHELFHSGITDIQRIDPKLYQRFLDIADKVSDEDIDNRAQLYNNINGHYRNALDWRNNPEMRLRLAEEALARQLREVTEIPKEGALAEFFQWLKDVWERIFGSEHQQNPNLQDLKDFWADMQEAVRSQRGESEVFQPPRYSLSPDERDLGGKYGAWLDPSGNIHWVMDRFGHEKKATEILGIPYNAQESNGEDQLMKMGWTRVMNAGDTIYSDKAKYSTLTPSQKKVLRSWHEGSNADVYFNQRPLLEKGVRLSLPGVVSRIKDALNFRRAGVPGYGDQGKFTQLDWQKLTDELELKGRSQVFGHITEDPIRRETVLAGQRTARDKTGGVDGAKAEVTPENTANNMKILQDMIGQRDYASKYVNQVAQDQMRASDQDPTNQDLKNLSYQAAGVHLQAELMDYAMRAAAEGDPNGQKMLDLAMPLANTVYVGDYGSVESSARILQARQWLTHEEGYWKTMRDLNQGRGEAAGKGAGGEGRAAKLIESTETPEVKQQAAQELTKDVQTAPEGRDIQNGLEEQGAAKDARTEAAENESSFKGALDILEGRAKFLSTKFLNHLQRLSVLAKALERMEAAEKKSDNPLKPSLGEARGDVPLKASDVDLSELKTSADVRSAIEKEKQELLKTLNELEGIRAKTGGKKGLNKADVEKATKVLSGTDKAKALLERLAKEPKKKAEAAEDPFHKDFQSQVRRPESFDEFSKKLDAHGVDKSLHRTLFDEAESQRQKINAKQADRQAKQAAYDASPEGKQDAGKRAAKVADDTAAGVMDALDKEQTEWVGKDQDKNAIRELARQAARDMGRGMNREWFEDNYRDKFQALGVSPEMTTNLIDRLFAKNRTLMANAEMRDRNRIEARGSIRSIIQAILGAPQTLRDSPEWRRQTILDFLTSNGMTEERAQKAAQWMDARFDAHLADAQAEAAEKAARSLGVDQPTIDSMLRAIRTRVLDPSNLVNTVAKALAEKAGFKELTPEQHQRMAQLDQKLSATQFPHERSKLLGEMNRIIETSRMPKKWHQIIAQSYVNSVLSSLSTIGLHYTQPQFGLAVRVGTEFAATLGDAVSGKMKRGEVPGALLRTFTNWLDSYRANIFTPEQRAQLAKAGINVEAGAGTGGVLDSWKSAIKSGDFPMKEARTLAQLTSLHRELSDSLEGLRTGAGGPLGMVKNFAKFAAASTDFSHRALLSGIEASTRTMEDFLTRQESMRELLKSSGMSESMNVELAATIAAKAENEGARVSQIKHDAGYSWPDAREIGRDAALQYMREATETAVRRPGVAESIRDYVEREKRLEVGQRHSEEGHFLDLPLYLSELAVGIGQLARNKGPIRGRMVTGFVSIPARLLDRSLYFTPIGIGRALAKTWELSKGENKLYKESIGTTRQLQQRFVEGVAGSAALAALLPLIYSQDKQNDPNYSGFRITLQGPKNKALNDVWKKNGNRAGSIEYVKNGKVVTALNYARGGPESLKAALLTLGTMDDMRLNGMLQNGSVLENSGEYIKELLSGGLKESAFFGLKNVAELPKMADESEKSVASNAAYLASGLMPWSGFVRSLGKLATGPLDDSSVKAALLAQTPFASFYGHPSMNFLGDQTGLAPEDATTTAADRLTFSGLPVYLGIKPDSADADLYRLMAEKGETPSTPSRSTLARRNGLVDDELWAQYVHLRGQEIKQRMYQQYGRLQQMAGLDFDKAIKEIDNEGTRRAKAQLRLK